jgi:membrane protease YdiL (CAAX protease family)
MLMTILIDVETGRLRSGWRVLTFLLLLISPWFFWTLLRPRQQPAPAAETLQIGEIGLPLVIGYLPLVVWVLLLSWGCLAGLEGLRPGALGLGFSGSWRRDIGRGLVIGIGMVGGIAGLQLLGGDSRIGLNPYWSSGGTINPVALHHSIIETGITVMMLLIAALYEELLYRGYAFQTLVRAGQRVVPIVMLSLLFGLGHWGNPNRTLFSTLNTVLAGVWLSLAYLKSRNLWYPTALHLGWNLALGPLFGIPVSGRLVPAHPLLLTTGSAAHWLTGGEYGSEGGAAATVMLLAAIGWEIRALRQRCLPD